MEKEKNINVQIDRHHLTVPEGTSILEAARTIGIEIPTLCHIDLKAVFVWLKLKGAAIWHLHAPPNVRKVW